MKDLLNTAIGPFTAKIWLAILTALALAAWAVVQIADNSDRRKIEVAKEAGAAGAVIGGQRDILDQVERANNAEQEIHRGGDADRHERCLRIATDATRANCERFRPVPD
jgi:hypothetical protein